MKDIPTLEARAEEHFKKSDEMFAEAILYRQEVTFLMEQLAEGTSVSYQLQVAINASSYEGQYLRRALRERRRGNRYAAKAARLREKESVLDRQLFPEIFGGPRDKADTEAYIEGGVIEKVWVDYASDPSNIFQETRERIAASEDVTSQKEGTKTK